ncbi:NAD(P)/FAD-dependent oxidoreductase [Fulvivirga sp. 29W222]|uniref:NAD(P)/FAD-dependent oxidoreductase n=1 Tax=Fulvivirga marina TaxID=2494733 RepID=A0A937FXE5_9BACT|nr:NAD(P)/FAD-dependent oxidoreductase [Fulvivirga marina]MBL6446288.1 NAD(P)/FAD-dependent oxidoreductase [Fulvivirga marina]
MRKVIVIGGGLAGLVTSICLRKAGLPVTLIEKKTYPFHRVCGEYISNEVCGFLERLQIFPDHVRPSLITRLQITSVNGKSAFLPLDMGGFGLSRFEMDYFMYQKAVDMGVEFILQSQAGAVRFEENKFLVDIEGASSMEAEVVVGAFGKRSRLDKQMGRRFLVKRSPYIGVKYHIQYDQHPDDLIALHNFKNGYCGINKIEEDKYNLCYLSARSNLSKSSDISDMEDHILSQNPHLKRIFTEAKFLFERPEVINEISFETKESVDQHVLMCGDAAGMITPLCGNGMAMAIRSAKTLSGEIINYFHNHHSREKLESNYGQRWRVLFERRLWAGRQIQKLFGSEHASNLAVLIARRSRFIADFLIKQTHGEAF